MVFGNRNRESVAEELIVKAAQVADSGDAKAAQTVSEEIVLVWREFWGGELKDRLWAANQQLLDMLQDTARSRRERAIRPCPCGATEFRLSEPFHIAEIVVASSIRRGPRFRLLLCPSCGRTEWLASDVEELLAEPMFSETVRVGSTAPYR